MAQNFPKNLIVVGIAALLGLALAEVADMNPWAFSVGFSVIAAVAVGVAGLFHQEASAFEKSTPPRKLLGLRISMVGFAVAVGGWLVSVYLSAAVGYYIVVVGVLTGFVGFPIHIFNMLRS